MTMLAAAVIALALLLTIAGTAYAWRDWWTKPHRYGYRPGERRRRLTDPARGKTREPIGRHWPRSRR